MPVASPHNSLRNPDDFLFTLPDWCRGLGTRLHQTILSAWPDLRETVKWGTLCFECGGLVCSLGAFQKHVCVSFFRGVELPDADRLFNSGMENVQMRAVRFTPVRQEFDPAALRRLVETAVDLNLNGPKFKWTHRPKPPLEIPDDLTQLLAKSAQAARHFEALPETGRRGFAHWISSAKRPETRAARLERSLRLLRAGRRPYDGKGPVD